MFFEKLKQAINISQTLSRVVMQNVNETYFKLYSEIEIWNKEQHVPFKISELISPSGGTGGPISNIFNRQKIARNATIKFSKS